MKLKDLAIARRSFLKAAAPCLMFAVGSRGSIVKSQVPAERGRFSESDLGWVRNQLLELVNSERSAAGLSQLQLDDLASSVANAHALDMVSGDFLSHWGSDGRGPYQRYSFAGGIDAVQENVSAADSIASVTPMRVFGDLQDMHTRMHAETPPNDGHRRAILEVTNTHVGFGVALKGRSLRLAEMYLSRYLEIDPFPQKVKRNETVTLTGKSLSGSSLHQIDIFLQPLPTAPDLAWLRTPRPYSLPQDYTALRPFLSEGATYKDGSRGNFDAGSTGKFKVRLKLANPTPGIYTIFFWLKKKKGERPIQVAQVCIRCD